MAERDFFAHSRPNEDHATWEPLAFERGATPLAFVIAGHHAGLANRQSRGVTGRRPVLESVQAGKAMLDACRGVIPSDIVSARVPPTPAGLPPDSKLPSEMWIRFLFSALVDADRLATERFYDPNRRANARSFASIATLRERLDAHLSRFRADTDVNRLRADVLRQCLRAAERRKGFFSLTVPTGGGKTLSSLAFALHHAERHGLRRVFVVIPYTSIIEQTARVFNNALADDEVIEHHAAFDERGCERRDRVQPRWTR